MKIFWLYELNGHGGAYQGCTGPDAERIVKTLAADPPEDGGSPAGAFPVYTSSPEQMWDRFIAAYSKKTGVPANNLIGGAEGFKRVFIEANKEK